MKTTSIELAERLDKLGVRKKSYMVYLTGAYLETDIAMPSCHRSLPGTEAVNAYTLDEILEMLPGHINEYPLYIKVKNPSNRYAVYYLTEDTNRFEDENAAEAAGELLAWCIENGHVKVEDLK